jgi:hypothetical protein
MRTGIIYIHSIYIHNGGLNITDKCQQFILTYKSFHVLILK